MVSTAREDRTGGSGEWGRFTHSELYEVGRKISLAGSTSTWRVGKGLTLNVSGDGPLALADHGLHSLGDLRTSARDVVKLGESRQHQFTRYRATGPTESCSKGRASSMFLRVVLRLANSAWILVAVC